MIENVKDKNTQRNKNKGKDNKTKSSFVTFKTRSNKILYVRPKDISAISAHSDGLQTRLYLKDVVEEIIIADTAENIMNKIMEFEKE